MSTKILKDTELLDIINRAPGEIDGGDQYRYFLEDLAGLIVSHFGGEFMCVTEPDDIMDSYAVSIDWNECVPSDGGIYRDYDKDVSFKEEDNRDG